jgi:hypothetical protein
MKLFYLLSFLILTSCISDPRSPEAALKDFIDSGVGKVVTRDFVLQRVTGKMRVSFENMGDEDFAKFADMRNIKAESFKVLSKSCQQKTCFLTYSVGYLTKRDQKTVFTSEIKKIAEIVEVDQKWLISDISNIKTYHEALEPIAPLE